MKYEKPGGMKKILIFLLFLSLIPSSLLAINGLGTFARPYHGSITADTVWNTASTKIFVNDDITVTAHLTINSGLTIVFVSAGADLIITGNGVLTASGGPGANMIRFSADFNNNGTYGETGETWGHISFQNMTPGFTTPSIIDNCIIEYGYKSGINEDARGGGILTTFTYLTISNSIIRNNFATFGGGIMAYLNAYPSILNCEISNNTAGITGGGLLLDQNPLSTIENCIIANNTCTGAGGGGGVFIGGNSGDVRFYNCTIVSNISSSNRGNNIRLYTNTASSYPKFFNTIAWGSDNSIQYYDQTIHSDDFNFCAIQGYTSGYTSCINLSGTNGDPTGPNFYNVTPGSEDYQIIFNSPCRDAGTAAGAPSTDILGHYRVELPDIGAYEVQYSNWTGVINTSWTNPTNWEASILPSAGSGDVIIPSNSGHIYPIGTPAPDFTIGTRKTMILRPGAEATLGNLTNNGTLRLEEDVTGISSLIFNSYTGNAAYIQLYLPGGGGSGTYKWHYISSPVATLAAKVFSDTTLDLARYDESLITTDQNNGWVAYDGWIYLPAPGHYGGTGFPSLNVGQGYNHYFKRSVTYTFSGSFNTGNVTVNLAYNSANSTPDYPNNQGFNLLGNPFPSCLDWSQISGSLNSSISQAIYFNKMGGFASWNNGVGTNGGTGTIPPMQGFFVKTYAKSTSVLLPASAMVHNATQTRYKKGLEVIIPLIRLKIEDKLNSDDAVVRFDEKATAGVDNAFDAYKFSKSGLSIWTSSAGVDFSINGLPFPDSVVVIPVSVNSTAAENLKISASEIDGLDNYTATLTDNINNISIDLKTTPSLSFDAPGGIVDNRFTLKVAKGTTVTTAVPETTVSDKPFNIYSSTGTVNIQTLSDIWNGKQGGIRVLDMTGRVFTTEDNVEFSKDNLLQIPVRAATGIYMVELRSGGMRYVGKVMIR